MSDTKKEEHTSKKFDTSLLLDNSPLVSSDYSDEAEILQYKIKTEGVKNIAVVANFGAGKSSAIETYLTVHRKGKKTRSTYTRISLASFNDAEYTDSDIERSILQQLLYSQPKRKLPNSRIERTTATPWWWTGLLALTIMIFFGSSILFGLQMGKVFLHEVTQLNWIFLVGASASFFTMLWIMLHFRKLQRVKYKDFEIELKHDGEERTQNGQSLINKFVDEVLYFFESTDINLVIFEDLDRLADEKSSAIFVKLRELNTIINNSHQRKAKVTFLYAVKDDMIKNQEERAKFFEFILPIVPILNPVTKAIKMLEEHDRMVKKDAKLELDGEFVNAISIYMPHMRTLKNSFNDYLITRRRVFKDSAEGRLHNENLFALCLYKNLYPYDYAQLEKGRGLIPIVMNKSHLINDEVNASQKIIKEFQQLLKKADAEYLHNFGELKTLLEADIANCSYNHHVNKPLVYLRDVTTFQDFDFNTIRHRSQSSYGTAIPIEISARFVEREAFILAKTKEGKERIAKEIEKEKQNILDYENMTLHELIRKRGVDFHFEVASDKDTTKAYLAEIKNSGVDKQEDNFLKLFDKNSKQLGYLKFLIQNGYIDEKYLEYTSSYKSTLISSTDETFIQKVQQGEQSFFHKIDNPGAVFSQLREKSFSDPAILNNTIFGNLKLLKEQSKKNNKYQLLRALLNHEQVSEAIITFIQNNIEEKVIEFLKEIIENNTNICARLIDSSLAEEKKVWIVTALIESMTDYSAHNTDNKITDFISSVVTYEEMLGKTNPVRVKKFLTQLKPRIEVLGSTENELTKHIVDNNLYCINIENLKKALGVEGESGGFYDENYAFITNSNDKVKTHIDVNPNEYVKNVLTNGLIPNKEESSAVVIDFLNRESVTSLQQIEIIKKYNFVIDNIEEYNARLHLFLLQFNRVKPTWKNILIAYLNNGYSDILKDFIIHNMGNIGGVFEYKDEKPSEPSDADEEIGKGLCERLFIDLANAEIDPNSLGKIADKMNQSYELYSDYTHDISIATLVAKGRLKFHSDDLQFMLDKEVALRQYIRTYVKKVDDNFDKFFSKINANGMRVLILSEQTSREMKQKLITQFGDKMVVDGFEKRYSKVITEGELKLPIVVLAKFRNSTLSMVEKLDLALLVSDKESNMALFNDYMKAAVPMLVNLAKEVRLTLEKETHKQVVELFARNNQLLVARGRGKGKNDLIINKAS